MFTRVRHLPLSLTTWVHALSSIYLRSNLILSSPLLLCLTSGVFTLDVPTKTPYVALLSTIRSACPAIPFFLIGSPEEYFWEAQIINLIVQFCIFIYVPHNQSWKTWTCLWIFNFFFFRFLDWIKRINQIALWMTAPYRCRLYSRRFGDPSRGKIEAGSHLLEPFIYGRGISENYIRVLVKQWASPSTFPIQFYYGQKCQLEKNSVMW